MIFDAQLDKALQVRKALSQSSCRGRKDIIQANFRIADESGVNDNKGFLSGDRGGPVGYKAPGTRFEASECNRLLYINYATLGRRERRLQ
jgi:hypothetical protein